MASLLVVFGDQKNLRFAGALLLGKAGALPPTIRMRDWTKCHWFSLNTIRFGRRLPVGLARPFRFPLARRTTALAPAAAIATGTGMAHLKN